MTYDFHRRKWVRGVRTRRDGGLHNCRWCKTPIPAGNPAFSISGFFQGSFFNGYMHPECEWACCAAYASGVIAEGAPYETHQWARGRVDNEKALAPQFPSTSDDPGRKALMSTTETSIS